MCTCGRSENGKGELNLGCEDIHPIVIIGQPSTSEEGRVEKRRQPLSFCRSVDIIRRPIQLRGMTRLTAVGYGSSNMRLKGGVDLELGRDLPSPSTPLSLRYHVAPSPLDTGWVHEPLTGSLMHTYLMTQK